MLQCQNFDEINLDAKTSGKEGTANSTVQEPGETGTNVQQRDMGSDKNRRAKPQRISSTTTQTSAGSEISGHDAQLDCI